jgi:hypothetical protein
MGQGPGGGTYGYAMPEPAESRDQPMSMLEAALFFGILVLILDAIGAVIGRATGLNLPVCICGNVFLYAAAGFVAARYTAVINGVWAGIMTAALDATFGQLVFMGILPGYREMMTTSAETQQLIPIGIIGVVIVIYVLVAALMTMFVGAFWGFLGAAISQSGPFRPKVYYAEEY